MKDPRFLLVVLIGLFAAQGMNAQNPPGTVAQVLSPDGQIDFTLLNSQNGLAYTVNYHGKPLISESSLGLEIQDQKPLGTGLQVVHVTPGEADETWTNPLGKSSKVRNHYKSARVDFAETAGLGRKLSLEIRAFDDGIAFRYVLPEQDPLRSFRITREETAFHFVNDATTYPLVLDGFQTSYEDDYQMRPVSGLHSDWLIALPLLAQVPGTGWAAITEADIENYPGMYLRHHGGWGVNAALTAELSPRIDEPGVAADVSAPMQTPWRVVMIGDEPGWLVESNIVLNLNPSSKIADTSWIKPGKAAWDWWSGHAATGVSFTPGMNTATMKHYIDFAAESGFPYMLIDAGWAARGKARGEEDITHVNPEVDMPELLRYAKEKNIRLWLWSSWNSVDQYMDEAFPLFEKWGIAGVKIDFMDRDDQWMVDFYRRVLKKAAEHHLMIDFHGAFKPDGVRRTYPNLLTREAVMGKEYLKVTARVTPVHDVTLPFTRMLAGPMDYTPGAFSNVTRENFRPQDEKPMTMNTRAHELALYVVFESPFQMVSDYPEQYRGQKDFEFLRNVPTVWDETHVLNGQPMEWITMARRSGHDWYLGSLTNWSQRDVKAPLSFLGKGKYVAEIYADAPDAATAPTHTSIEKREVDSNSVLDIHMAPGGGNAIWIHPSQ